MPTRVLLEGPAIEPLLAQVREEYGSGVRIISADKVRSGGFGGFFAKQHYELSVEVPDPTEDRTDMARQTRRPPRPATPWNNCSSGPSRTIASTTRHATGAAAGRPQPVRGQRTEDPTDPTPRSPS